ncbi:glycosyltransferase family 2 protein [Pragia fontium]|uniref:Glycosyltransferase involved in cell wall bisynthesis n=2 Tax=Pragia fontium TaxID=82985 RepID=A0AAJ4WCL5_9GAMM|nr:glycosyltransferase family 2 protein [Pragia fontium]GKX64239.1 family 2 glycosyl transferase [Pragia fontium]SFD22795.1 Glycosyltransferase involved in cell wall bisynthesis [Pragia fontium DSM 5563 = ATCC 49100]VEJ56928.1 transferase 2, rSAM/selenodomain-associated [Pragia fontium]
MFPLSVCVLTFNSARLLKDVLTPLAEIADELIIVDSGSSDETLEICQEFGIKPVYRAYTTHGEQMNYAISQVSNQWVLCMDSDEILDPKTVEEIKKIKSGAMPDPHMAFRISRHWFVLGQEVHNIYPVTSPDYPVRLFNRECVGFNNQPVDDAAEGYSNTAVIAGFVKHDTFFSIHEVFNKLNGYTTRLVKYKHVKPSLARGMFSAFGSFWKWYIFKNGWKDGKVGVVTGTYAVAYSFMKYLKAWYQNDASPKK